MSTHDDLVARFGTPLYVYDLDRLTAARDALRASLPDGFTLFYSLKANPHPEIARALGQGEGGCRPELSSTGELASALEAGFAAADCLYTGPGKTPGELREAIAAGVRTFSVESATDLRHVGEAALAHDTIADCLLRINAVSTSASTSIRMTGTPSQFGFDSETLPALLGELLTTPGTRVVGTHFFPLSNSRDENALVSEFRQSIETAARLRDELGLPMRLLDIGGGFAAPYAAPGTRPVYDKLRAELENALELHFPGWREDGPEVACESGRHLTGDCGTLLTSVVNVKDSRGRKFVILDAGINTLGGMSGLGRLLPITITPDDAGEGEPASLVGPLCTPGDLLGRDLDLPSLAAGDVVSVPNVGAYGVTASLLHFLSRPAPAEVFLRGGEVVSASRLEARRTPLS